MYEYSMNKASDINELLDLLQLNGDSVLIAAQENVINGHFYIEICNNTVIKFRIGVLTSCENVIPNCLLIATTLFVGSDNHINIINLSTKLKREIITQTHFFEFILCNNKNLVVGVCEADLIFLDKEGNIVDIKGLSDIITAASITPDDKLSIDLYEGKRLVIILPTLP